MATTKNPTEEKVKIPAETLVKVEVPVFGGGIPIQTINREGRQYFREKRSQKRGQFLFGKVLSEPYGNEGEMATYYLQWSGRRYRTSFVAETRIQRVKTRS